MLTIHEISDIFKKIDSLYRDYRKSYAQMKRGVFLKGDSVKYSSGGKGYPFGKYYFGKSKLYRKAERRSSGHFCKTLDEANFAYVFSSDGEMLAINQMFDNTKNLSGYVDKTAFLVNNFDETYILKYDDDTATLDEIGLMYSRNNLEIMVHSDAPCLFLVIIVMDNQKSNEYLYSIGRELFTAECDLTSNELYKDYSELNY